MSKISKGKCVICGESKERQRKVRLDGKTVFVIPNTSIEWGNMLDLGGGTKRKCAVCPDCISLEDVLVDPNAKLTLRLCRECGNQLPRQRYYECTTCKPALGIFDDDFIYETSPSELSPEDEDFFEMLEGVEDGEYQGKDAVEDSDEAIESPS